MTAHFDRMIAGIAARVEPQAAPVARYTLRAVEAWADLATNATSLDNTAFALGLDLEDKEASEDWARWCAMFDLGLRAASIVREPAFTVDRRKAHRDEELGRPTMHLAQQWRWPQSATAFFPAEKGIRALMLPVGATEGGSWSHKTACTLSLTELGEEEFCASIADLVAIPLDGGRALSMTGYTAAIGSFEPDARGRLSIHGGGKAWLDAWLAEVTQLCADTPGHLVQQLHMPFEAPESLLLLEPQAFEWRIARGDCVLPPHTKDIVCPDSRKLAEWIDAELRKKDKPRQLPTVRGPANTSRSNTNQAERVAA